jgi:WD40 repeat protein
MRFCDASAFGVICVLLCSVLLRAQVGAIRLEETILGTVPGKIRGELQVSPNNRHVFAHVATGNGWAFYRDGVFVGRYDGKLPSVQIPESSVPGIPLEYSKDGEHYAFIAERNGQHFVVHDGIEDGVYDEILRLRLSATGKVVYTIFRLGEQRLVFDGQIGPAYSEVRGDFSPDGEHFVSIASTGTVSRIFLDGEPQIETIPEGDPRHGGMSISAQQFSPDSKHFVFVASSNLGSRVVLDGKTVGTYSGLIGRDTGTGNFVFSPDGRHLAFYVRPHLPRINDPWILVVDGVERNLSPSELERELPFFMRWSSDGQHFAYALRRDSKASYPSKSPILRNGGDCPTQCWRMFLDGMESPTYFGIDTNNAQFLDDGRLVYSAYDGGRWITMIGNEQITDARILAITPDGKHRVFALADPWRPGVDPENPMLIDGKRYSQAHEYCCFPRFSGPGGRHFVYGTYYPRDKAFVVIDGVRQKLPGQVLFTPDENHVALLYSDDVFVDGTRVVSPGNSGPKFAFSGNEGFRVFALRGDQIVRSDGKF